MLNGEGRKYLGNWVDAVTFAHKFCWIMEQTVQTTLSELDKTADYFSFGVKSCWVVIPALQSIVLFSSPLQKEIFKTGETLYDPNIDVTMPLDTIFA